MTGMDGQKDRQIEEKNTAHLNFAKEHLFHIATGKIFYAWTEKCKVEVFGSKKKKLNVKRNTQSTPISKPLIVSRLWTACSHW